jgi:hypothetical protein
MDRSWGGESIMDNCIVEYCCSLKEAWKEFIEYMKSADPDDRDDIVFVYDKTEDSAWVVEEDKLDDFAESLWNNHSLGEKGPYTDDYFEDYVIIKLIDYDEEDQKKFPLSFKSGKRTGVPGYYRFTHYFTVDFSPQFGSTV